MLFKTFVLLTIIISIFSKHHLNQKYAQILQGNRQLNDQISRQIYSQYVSKYAQSTQQRFQIFNRKLKDIQKHNSQNKGWKKGINQFSHLTFDQVKKLKLMVPQDCSATQHHLKVSESYKKTKLPESFQWNDFNVITPVKDQGDCGSCWAFSTVGTLQAHWNIIGKGKNILFSEQQLVDCAWAYDNFGCDGGLPSQAFEYIKDAKGIQRSQTYPYTQRDGQCQYNPARAVGYSRYGSYNITAGDQNQLAQRVFNVGPVSICYEVLDDFIDYQSGIYTSDECGTTNMDVNHAVVLTGFGVTNGTPYWNVKNSWSEEWGNNGYFQIVRGKNMCAISQCNSYPLIDNAFGLQGLQELMMTQ